MLWVASQNPADDPTRGVCVRQATERTDRCQAAIELVPQQLLEQYAAPSHCTRLAWEEQLLAFDCTKGFEGEGPLKRTGPVDLTLSVLPAT
eukprot:1806648-Amphidinium_carterae.2